METAPRATVLMAVYNGLPYVAEAIDSVLRQTFQDFELVIIDDASTDESVACIRRSPDPRIRLWVNPRNRGQAGSLNEGLARARAPYVARLDQDDVCLPGRLQRQVALLDARPDVAVVGTLMAGMDAGGRHTVVMGRTLDNYGAFVGSLLLELTPVCHPSVMFRREIVASVGGYDESFAPAEDVELWTRLALRRQTAYVIPELLMRSRMHERQQSVTQAAVQRRQIRRAQQRLIGALYAGEDRRGVSRLLSMDTAFWAEYRSREALVRVCTTLKDLLKTIRIELKLSDEDWVTLVRMIDRWLGPGVRLAPQLAHWPTPLFYGALGLFSPLMVPNVRPILSRLISPIRRLRGNVMMSKLLAASKGV